METLYTSSLVFCLSANAVIGYNCASKHSLNNLPTPALILQIQTLPMTLTPTPLRIFLAQSIHKSLLHLTFIVYIIKIIKLFELSKYILF